MMDASTADWDEGHVNGDAGQLQQVRFPWAHFSTYWIGYLARWTAGKTMRRRCRAAAVFGCGISRLPSFKTISCGRAREAGPEA